MPDVPIPTAAQVRAMPVHSVAVLRAALRNAGLHVEPGGRHLKVTLADRRFVGTMPMTPSDPRALMNYRSHLARRVEQIRTRPADGGPQC